MLGIPPLLASEMGWTGELCSNNILLKWPDKDISISFSKKIFFFKYIFFPVILFTIFPDYFSQGFARLESSGLIAFS